MEKPISKERKSGSRLPRMFAAGLLLAGIGGMFAGTSCETRPSNPVSSEPPESAPVSEPEKTVADLAENCPYFYEYGCIVSGDDHLNVLTSPGGGEVVLKPREGLGDDGKPLPMKFKSSDWNKTERELDVPNDYAVLSVDLGCLCGLTGFEIDGSAVEYELSAGQQLVIDTGNLAMIDATCGIDVVTVKGVKNALLGGEGLFHTVVTGPGKVTLQTMPLSSFVGTISALLPTGNK